MLQCVILQFVLVAVAVVSVFVMVCFIVVVQLESSLKLVKRKIKGKIKPCLWVRVISVGVG